MKIIFHIAHPSQFYILKNIANNLDEKHEIIFTYTLKDILEDLILNSDIANKAFPVESEKRVTKSSFSHIKSLIGKERKLFNIAYKFKPDLIIGTSIAIAHVACLIRAKSIILNEDDFDIVKTSAKIGYPFVNHIISPRIIRMGKWKKKVVSYNGYQKLIYLHPTIFSSNSEVKNKTVGDNEQYSLIRFAKLSAHHDVGIEGLNINLVRKLLVKLEQVGKVFISSEIELPDDLKKHEIKLPPQHIHTILKNAKLLISDSQSMSVEAAMLGTPSIRFNDFAGRISVLEELELKYELTYGVKSSCPEQLFKKVDELLDNPDLNSEFKMRRDIMLKEKINVLDFMTWFINNYPSSVKIVRENPDIVDDKFNY